MRLNKSADIAAPHGAHVSALVISRNCFGEIAVAPDRKNFETSRHTATQENSMTGLSAPNLKFEQREADERRRPFQHQRQLQRRTKVAPFQQKAPAYFSLRSNRRTHVNGERSNTEVEQVYGEPHSRKRAVPPVEPVCTSSMLRVDLREERRPESPRTPEKQRFRPRPGRPRSASVHLMNEQNAQLTVFAQHTQAPLLTEQSNKQSVVKPSSLEARAKSQQARRKPLLVGNLHKRPAANNPFAKTSASHLCHEQNKVGLQQGLTLGYKTESNLINEPTQSSSFESKKFLGVSNVSAKLSEDKGLDACTGSRQCQDSGNKGFLCQTFLRKCKTPKVHLEWLQQLKHTILRVRDLRNQLTTCDDLEHHGPGICPPEAQKKMPQPWLEALLFVLANTLRTGPPGGTLQETASLLNFLGQQRSSALCAGKMRHLLESVAASLKRKFQKMGGTTVCYKRFYLRSAQTTSSFAVRQNHCFAMKAACSHSTSDTGESQTTKKPQVNEFEQHEQVTDSKASLPRKQRTKLAMSQKLSGKSGAPVSAQQITDAPPIQCLRNHADATKVMQRITSSSLRQALNRKHNGDPLARPCTFLVGKSLPFQSGDQSRERVHSRQDLPSPLEAFRCLSRLEEAHLKAAATLQCFEEAWGAETVPQPTSVPVDGLCSSHKNVLLHHAHSREHFVLRLPKNQLQFTAKISCSRGSRKVVNGQKQKEGVDVQVFRHSHSPSLVQRLMAFREVRMGLQAFSVPFLYEEHLQRELRQLEGSVGVYKAIGDAAAGLWTLQAATAEHVLQRELQQVVHLINAAIAAFVDRILATEVSRMANVVHALSEIRLRFSVEHDSE